MADQQPTLADMIAAVRDAAIPYRSQYTVGVQYKTSPILHAAAGRLAQSERIERERDVARADLANMERAVATEHREAMSAKQELAEEQRKHGMLIAEMRERNAAYDELHDDLEKQDAELTEAHAALAEARAERDSLAQQIRDLANFENECAAERDAARAELADLRRRNYQTVGELADKCRELSEARAEIGRLRQEAAPAACDLFVDGAFTAHSGDVLPFKIECDALSDASIATIAKEIARRVGPFGSVRGVPRGGLRLAAALSPYVTEGPPLLVDDVLTTGTSMEAARQPGDIGAVIFARGPCPHWITPIFIMGDPRVRVSVPTVWTLPFGAAPAPAKPQDALADAAVPSAEQVYQASQDAHLARGRDAAVRVVADAIARTKPQDALADAAVPSAEQVYQASQDAHLARGRDAAVRVVADAIARTKPQDATAAMMAHCLPGDGSLAAIRTEHERDLAHWPDVNPYTVARVGLLLREYDSRTAELLAERERIIAALREGDETLYRSLADQIRATAVAMDGIATSDDYAVIAVGAIADWLERGPR